MRDFFRFCLSFRIKFSEFSVSDLQYLSLLYRLYNGFIAFLFLKVNFKIFLTILIKGVSS